MRFRRALIPIAAVAAALATTLTATPASALATVAVAQAGDGAVNMIGTGEAVRTLNLNGTVDVAVSCQAVAIGIVAGTGVGCYLIGVTDGLGYYFDDGWHLGNVSETDKLFQNLPAQAFRLCIGLGYDQFGTGIRTRWLPHTPGDNCSLVVL